MEKGWTDTHLGILLDHLCDQAVARSSQAQTGTTEDSQPDGC